MPINPAFHRFPTEAALVGRLLAAFGELEISVCHNASKATGLGDAVLTSLYRIRATRSRLEAADGLMRPAYLRYGLEPLYADAFGKVNYCHSIRNQFAHCNWADDQSPANAGLFFADLTESAKTPNFEIFWKHVDVLLLESLETYFDNVLEALRFADHELAVKQGKLQSHFWPKPPTLPQPPRHNHEALHIPPWITEEAKALHVARALAVQGGDPTPTPAHKAMEAARAAKRSQRQADRDASKRSRLEPPSDRS